MISRPTLVKINHIFILYSPFLYYTDLWLIRILKGDAIIWLMEQAIDALFNAFQKELGTQLELFCLFGSVTQNHYHPGRSDINLLVMVAEDVSLHNLRRLFLPLWANYRQVLKRPPLVATRSQLVRHLQLNPLLAQHILECGQLLTGTMALLSHIPIVNEVDDVAYWANVALQASSALAPQLVGPENGCLQQMESLNRRLLGQPAASSPDETFALIQLKLQQMMAQIPAGQWPWPMPKTVESPTQPNLLAVYQEADCQILLIPPLSKNLLDELDWRSIATRLQQRGQFLRVAMPTQFKLALFYEQPVELVLNQYQRVWGQDVLCGLSVNDPLLFRACGRQVSNLLLGDLPAAYLTAADDEAVHRVIHDLQNQLLNVHLQNELLQRFGRLENSLPPPPLPGRDTPSTKRVEAIANQLNWWASRYWGKMIQSQ